MKAAKEGMESLDSQLVSSRLFALPWAWVSFAKKRGRERGKQQVFVEAKAPSFEWGFARLRKTWINNEIGRKASNVCIPSVTAIVPKIIKLGQSMDWHVENLPAVIPGKYFRSFRVARSSSKLCLHRNVSMWMWECEVNRCWRWVAIGAPQNKLESEILNHFDEFRVKKLGFH